MDALLTGAAILTVTHATRSPVTFTALRHVSSSDQRLELSRFPQEECLHSKGSSQARIFQYPASQENLSQNPLP